MIVPHRDQIALPICVDGHFALEGVHRAIGTDRITRLTQWVSRRRACTVRIRHASSSDRNARFALTQVISEPGHLALERVDAFAEVAMARDT